MIKKYGKISFIFLEIWPLIKSIRKFQIILLFLFTLISAFLEVISIGAVIPFMEVMLDPSIVQKYLNYLSNLNLIDFNFNNFTEYEVKLYFTIFFIITVIISSLSRFFVYYLNLKISYLTDFDLKNDTFSNLSNTNLKVRKILNINETLSSFEKIKSIYKSLHSTLLVLTGSLYSLIILSSILYIDFTIVFSLFMFSIIFFGTVLLLTKKKFENLSKIHAQSTDKMYELLNYSFNYFKIIILDKINDYYIKNFRNSTFQISNSSIKTRMITAFTSSFFITSLTIFIVLLLFNMSLKIDLQIIMPKIIAITIGAQRLIQSLSSIFNNFQKNLFLKHPVLDALKFIKKIKSSKKLKLKINTKKIIFKEIELKNISYKIKNQYILNKINLKLKYNDKVLIHGKTGSGKTSLIDVIAGLTYDFEGKIKIAKLNLSREKSELMRNLVSMVPQQIFIFQSTIQDNIVFEEINKDVDMNKLKKCIKCADLEDFVSIRKNKLNYKLNFDGQNISGGQKQRIGIARALYKDTPIIIFDEATNALDFETEKKIFENINRFYKDRLLICINHNARIGNYFNKKINLSKK
jgi:ATP-binding cassette subfamily B protein